MLSNGKAQKVEYLSDLIKEAAEFMLNSNKKKEVK